MEFPMAMSKNSEDCDDSNIEITPNADEICDYIDEDEDGFGDDESDR